MSIKKAILNPLLDKYESSRHFSGKAKVNRRIMLKLKPPLYNIEDLTKKLAVHNTLKELQEKDLISIHWLKGEAGNIVKEVELNLDTVGNSYKELNRQQKSEQLILAITNLNQLLTAPHQWLKDFAGHTIETIETKHDLPAILPQDDNQQQLIKGLIAIAALDGEEVLERVFSKHAFGDSKYFERHLRSKTASILKDWLLKDGVYDSAIEMLQAVGINKSSDELLFSGAIQVEFNGKSIDFADFTYGTAIGSRMVRELTITGFTGQEVITVENKASYRDLCSQTDHTKTTVIYTGGFPGPAKRLFLHKLYTYAQANNPSVRFRHWGDIDLGGFRIFVALRKVVPTLEPMLMDVETLRQYREKGQPLSKGYDKLLKELLENEEFVMFHEVTRLMLAEDVRLEQEGICLSMN